MTFADRIRPPGIFNGTHPGTCEPDVTRMLLHVLGPIDSARLRQHHHKYFPRSNGLKYDTLAKCAAGKYTSSGFSQMAAHWLTWCLCETLKYMIKEDADLINKQTNKPPRTALSDNLQMSRTWPTCVRAARAIGEQVPPTPPGDNTHDNTYKVTLIVSPLHHHLNQPIRDDEDRTRTDDRKLIAVNERKKQTNKAENAV